MNPRILHQFLALADALHYGRASVAANVSLSTLSRSIRQLEIELGVDLFTRDNRSVRMTPKGYLFEQYARDALTRFNMLKHQLNDAAGPLKGELSLYCSVTASHSILFNLLERFRPDFPQVEIKLQTGDPEDAINRIVAGKEDITIAAHPKSLPRGVVYQPVSRSPLLFIAPVQHIDPDIPAVDNEQPVDWSEVPMILSISGIARTRLDAWFRTRKVSPKIYAQVAGNEAIVSMVSLGLGVGVVPEIVLQNSPLSHRVRVMTVEPQLQPFDLGLFALNKSMSNPLVQAFWETSQILPSSASHSDRPTPL
ncbi:MAG: HTH-type transcriptional activator IlvY [Granulosicoccus sp.]